MNYSNDEKESVFLFDYVQQVWKVETNVPSHMTRLMKVAESYEVLDTFESRDGSEKPSMIRAVLPKNAITIRDYLGKGKSENEKRKKERNESSENENRDTDIE